MTNKDYEKTEQIYELLLSVDDYLIHKFFDLESDKLLDDKIEVLTDLKNGKAPADIPKYHDILELYPKDENTGDIVTEILRD